MQVLLRVCIEACSFVLNQLIDDLAFSTSMSSYKDTTGTGELSQKSSTFAISHSKARPAEIQTSIGVNRCQ